MTRPTAKQLSVWSAYMYDGLSQAEGMRILRIKHRMGFQWWMNAITRYVLNKHPRIS